VRDKDSRPGGLVFNRTVGLRDTWAKVSGQKG
jgi:glutaminyl-tRNA synthetase